MKSKLISILSIMAVASLCSAGSALAVTDDSILSNHIAEADGTSGQDTNSGNGIKTGHIQDSAVTDAKISDVSMSKVTGLQAAIAAIPAGPEGPQGPEGADGADGQDGADGLSCWDLDGDNVADANEDMNGDGYWDALDCQGTVDGVLYMDPYYLEPFTCDNTVVGAVSLTSRFTLCVCNGTDWVKTVDGTTSCEWLPPGTVYSPATGRVWMDRNLGASRVATSYDDAAAFGDLYQWGRLTDGHQLRTSGVIATPSSTDEPGHPYFISPGTYATWDWRDPYNSNLWQGGVAAINNPCPSGFRLPTKSEFTAEASSFNPINMYGAFASPLKLTAGGHRKAITAVIENAGISGDYWISDPHGNQWSDYFWITELGAVINIQGASRAQGKSVRCIMD